MYTSKIREHASAILFKNTLMLVDNNNYNIYFVMIFIHISIKIGYIS